MSKNWKLLFFSAFMIVGFMGCQDPWEEHDKINADVTGDNLMELIRSKSELSAFADYLKETGMDSVITTNRTYTVWAPSNEALSALDNSIVNDPVKLKQFVANHISFTLYSYFDEQPAGRIKTLSGKTILLNYLQGKVDDANLVKPYDLPAKNGILHIIDKSLIPKMNIWEFIQTTNLCKAHTDYINSLTGEIFNPRVARKTGYDPLTYEPIYDTVTGMVWSNPILAYVRDLSNEDSLSTVFLVSDEVFQQEFDKFRKYYTIKDNNAVSDSLTYWNVAKDYIFRGKYDKNSIHDTLVSMFNVKVPFNKFAIDSAYSASNGMVYIMHDCPVALPDKIQPIILQGEDSTNFVIADISGQTGYMRKRPNASGGYDFILDNHAANPGGIVFHAGMVAATRYQFYIKAIDDFNYSYRYPNTTDTIKERIGSVMPAIIDGEQGFTTPSPFTTKYIAVTDTSYTTAAEMPAGNPIFFNYRDLWIELAGIGNNTTVAVDYIKLVPVFE
jgi:uncharacterized surface protein with fasciclin (FAS1) repeats